MRNYEAEELLKKYQSGSCTDEELSLLESWYNDDISDISDLDLHILARAKEEVFSNLPLINAPKKLKIWPSIAVAASLILISSVGLFLFSNNDKSDSLKNTVVINKIQPDRNKSKLKLEDGSEIVLSELPIGKILKQGGITIVKNENGQLIYTAEPKSNTEKVTYNTISTSYGDTHQVILPDGTHVWLNAVSSLKYPTAFVSGERNVELEGEAYFEVAHDEHKPFNVITEKQKVTVLGTHFNLEAYKDDNFSKTTLFEGKVAVKSNNSSVELKPNEQAYLNGNSLKVKAVLNDNDLAWKNNEFSFHKEPLEEILNTLGRWYNVEFLCPNEMKMLQFGGVISRDKSLTQALKIIEQEGTIHFKTEGRKITVMK